MAKQPDKPSQPEPSPDFDVLLRKLTANLPDSLRDGLTTAYQQQRGQFQAISAPLLDAARTLQKAGSAFSDLSLFLSALQRTATGAAGPGRAGEVERLIEAMRTGAKAEPSRPSELRPNADLDDVFGASPPPPPPSTLPSRGTAEEFAKLGRDAIDALAAGVSEQAAKGTQEFRDSLHATYRSNAEQAVGEKRSEFHTYADDKGQFDFHRMAAYLKLFEGLGHGLGQGNFQSDTVAFPLQPKGQGPQADPFNPQPPPKPSDQAPPEDPRPPHLRDRSRTFKFEAVDTSGAEVFDTVKAASEDAALELIKAMGYFVTKVKEVTAGGAGASPPGQPPTPPAPPGGTPPPPPNNGSAGWTPPPRPKTKKEEKDEEDRATPLEKLGLALGKMGQAATVAAIPVLTIQRVLNSLGGALAEFVSLANPGVVQQFNLALRDTMAVIGRALIPVLSTFTGLIRRIGDAFASLSDQAKKLFGGLVAGGGIAGVIGAIAAAVGGLVAVVGGPIAAFIGIGSALAGLALQMAEGQQIISALTETFTTVFGLFQQVAGAVLGPMLAVGTGMMKVFAGLQPVLRAVIDAVMPIVEMFGKQFTAVFGLLGGVLAPVARLAGALVRVIATLAEAIGKLLSGAFGRLVDMMVGPLVYGLNLFAQAVEYVVGVVEKAIERFRSMLGLDDKKYDPNKVSSAGAAVRPAEIGTLQSAIARAYSSAAMSGVASVEKQQLDKLKSIDDKLGKMLEKKGERVAERVANSIPVVGPLSVGDLRDIWRRIKR